MPVADLQTNPVAFYTFEFQKRVLGDIDGLLDESIDQQRQRVVTLGMKEGTYIVVLTRVDVHRS